MGLGEWFRERGVEEPPKRDMVLSSKVSTEKELLEIRVKVLGRKGA